MTIDNMLIGNAFIKVWYELKKYEKDRLKENINDIAKWYYESHIEQAAEIKKYFNL
jgi:hypothetical protein